MKDLYAPLVKALRRREAECRAVIDQHLSDHADRWLLLEAVELVACLRRILPTLTRDELHRAFGAPGDFGYDTPVGDALHRIYHAAPEAEGQARRVAIAITPEELDHWHALAATMLEQMTTSGVGFILMRLLDALDALTGDGERLPTAERAPSGAGVHAAVEVVDACSRAIGLVSRYSDELKMTFATTLIRQLAFDLAGRAELTPRELMIQMAHRALGVYRVGPGEVVPPSNTNG